MSVWIWILSVFRKTHKIRRDGPFNLNVCTVIHTTLKGLLNIKKNYLYYEHLAFSSGNCKVLTWISVFFLVEHDEKQFNHFSPMLDFIYKQRKSNDWFLYDMQNEMKWVNFLPCFFLWLRTKVFFSTAFKVSVFWSFSLPYFPVFGLNKEIYKVNFRIQSKRGKILRTRTLFMRWRSCTAQKIKLSFRDFFKHSR